MAATSAPTGQYPFFQYSSIPIWAKPLIFKFFLEIDNTYQFDGKYTIDVFFSSLRLKSRV